MENIKEVILPYLKDIRDFLDLELSKFELLKDEMKIRIMDDLGISEIHGDIYYNDLNIVFTTTQDWMSFRHIITTPEIIFRLEIPEYKQFLLVVRRHNDVLLDQLLGIT
jgi:hypothetical protein